MIIAALPEAEDYVELISPGISKDRDAMAFYEEVRAGAVAVLAHRRSIFDEKMRLKQLRDERESSTSNTTSPPDYAPSNDQSSNTLPADVVSYLERIGASIGVMQEIEFIWLQCLIFRDPKASFSEKMEMVDVTARDRQELMMMMMRGARN